jgi:hypothetical protein
MDAKPSGLYSSEKIRPWRSGRQISQARGYRLRRGRGLDAGESSCAIRSTAAAPRNQPPLVGGVFGSVGASIRLLAAVFWGSMRTIEPPSFALQETEPGLLSYGLQQIAVPVASLFPSALVVEATSSFAPSGTLERIIAVGCCFAASAIVGVIYGVLIRNLFPGARSTGKWVWIVPVLILLIGLILDFSAFSLKVALRDSFIPRGGGKEWLVVWLVTCPAISTVFYSAAMTRWFRPRWQELSRQ